MQLCSCVDGTWQVAGLETGRIVLPTSGRTVTLNSMERANKRSEGQVLHLRLVSWICYVQMVHLHDVLKSALGDNPIVMEL